MAQSCFIRFVLKTGLSVAVTAASDLPCFVPPQNGLIIRVLQLLLFLICLSVASFTPAFSYYDTWGSVHFLFNERNSYIYGSHKKVQSSWRRYSENSPVVHSTVQGRILLVNANEKISGKSMKTRQQNTRIFRSRIHSSHTYHSCISPTS